MYNQDPWSWVDQQKPTAPMVNTIAPLAASQEQAPGAVNAQDPTMQQLQAMGTGKLIEGTASGISTGIKAGMGAANAAATTVPTAAELGGSFATQMAAAGVPGTAVAGAAPLAAGTAASTAGTAATTGLAAGGEAALAAMGPIGWAVGAGLLAHKLGIF